jgi:hypothetical protein
VRRRPWTFLSYSFPFHFHSLLVSLASCYPNHSKMPGKFFSSRFNSHSHSFVLSFHCCFPRWVSFLFFLFLYSHFSILLPFTRCQENTIRCCCCHQFWAENQASNCTGGWFQGSWGQSSLQEGGRPQGFCPSTKEGGSEKGPTGQRRRYVFFLKNNITTINYHF